MLMSLVSLSDEEIEAVTAAVSQWCKANQCHIDSSEGQRAIAIAIDVVQMKSAMELPTELAERMAQMDAPTGNSVETIDPSFADRSPS